MRRGWWGSDHRAAGPPDRTLVGLIGLSLGLTLVCAATSLWMSILGCGVMGTLGTLLLVIGPALLAETAEETRGLAFAEQNLIAYFGALATPPAVWLAVQLSGWRAAMLLGWLTLAVGVRCSAS